MSKVKSKTFCLENFSIKLFNFTDCINSLCACRHLKKLPNPKFTPKINNGQLHIDWEIDPEHTKSLPNGTNLDHLIIR